MARPAVPCGMPLSPLHIVWFKRDLRVTDHAPLRAAAAQAGRLLPVFFLEPAVHRAADAAPQHRGFIREALLSLDQALSAWGHRVWVAEGNATDELERLWQRHPFTHLHSHQETGNAATFARDVAVARWCHARGVHWTEYTQDGVVRRLRHRGGWAKRWDERNRQAPVGQPNGLPPPPGPAPEPPPLAAWALDGDLPLRQRGGRPAAEAALHSFLWERGQTYQRAMSSPLVGAEACSRISPYLAHGTLSLREVVAAVSQRRVALQSEPPDAARRAWLASLNSFEGRLYWHCHFMQKLESEPAIESHNMVRAFDGLRENDFNPDHFARWRTGHTGYPMVDACMRMLNATGWLNFRMRAMLVSFAAYPLWLHWREPALHLARAFLDYEPGIHYSQMQMQSGTTGINTPRLYNPIKQARDHDPDGDFVRHWLPELSGLPTDWLFEPWRLPASLQSRYGCRIERDYPLPLVDFNDSVREAKAKLAVFRGSAAVRAESRDVFERHGSRRSGMRSTGRGPERGAQASGAKPPAATGSVPQLSLDWGDG